MRESKIENGDRGEVGERERKRGSKRKNGERKVKRDTGKRSREVLRVMSEADETVM